MQLRRDRLMIVLRPSVVRHKFRLCTGFRRDALTGRPLRYRSQAIKIYAAICRMRRGRSLTSQTAFGGQLPYKGSLVRPAVRFGYSLFDYGGMFLRATNHEPRATIFSRAEGYSRRCLQFEFDAAQRHLSLRRPAGPSGPRFDERWTTYDERLFTHILEYYYLLITKMTTCDKKTSF